MNNNEKKIEKRNIILMIVIAILGIIGIATRWQQTKSEIKSGVNNYISIDSTENQ